MQILSVNTFSYKNKRKVICVAKDPDTRNIFLLILSPCVKLNDRQRWLCCAVLVAALPSTKLRALARAS
jgi:hypothetical protein